MSLPHIPAFSPPLTSLPHLHSGGLRHLNSSLSFIFCCCLLCCVPKYVGGKQITKHIWYHSCLWWRWNYIKATQGIHGQANEEQTSLQKSTVVFGISEYLSTIEYTRLGSSGSRALMVRMVCPPINPSAGPGACWSEAVDYSKHWSQSTQLRSSSPSNSTQSLDLRLSGKIQGGPHTRRRSLEDIPTFHARFVRKFCQDYSAWKDGTLCILQ